MDRYLIRQRLIIFRRSDATGYERIPCGTYADRQRAIAAARSWIGPRWCHVTERSDACFVEDLADPGGSFAEIRPVGTPLEQLQAVQG